MSITSITKEVVEELKQAEAKFGPFNSSHEGYAVILEEMDELWEVVKLNPKKIVVSSDEVEEIAPLQFPLGNDEEKLEEAVATVQKHKRNQAMKAEAIQVAAMAIRFIKCICDQDKE
jgi:hypothetical protein